MVGDGVLCSVVERAWRVLWGWVNVPWQSWSGRMYCLIVIIILRMGRDMSDTTLDSHGDHVVRDGTGTQRGERKGMREVMLPRHEESPPGRGFTTSRSCL